MHTRLVLPLLLFSPFYSYFISFLALLLEYRKNPKDAYSRGSLRSSRTGRHHGNRRHSLHVVREKSRSRRQENYQRRKSDGKRRFRQSKLFESLRQRQRSRELVT